MDAEAYLRRLTDERIAEIERSPDDGRGLLAGLRQQEIEGAASALIAAGLLDATQAEHVVSAFHREVESRGLIERIDLAIERHEVSATAESDAAQATPPAGSTETPQLLRVVGIAEEMGTVDSARLVLLSVDVWSSGINLHYTLVPAPVARPRGDGAPYITWKAWADDGTHLEPRGGAFHAGEVLVGNHWLEPAPQPAAHALTIIAERGRSGALIGQIVLNMASPRR